MRVDPATGMPLEEIDHGGTFSQDIVQGALESAGAGDSRFFAAAEHIPNTFQTVGWNAMRGSNTITKGVKGGRVFSKPHGTGMIRGAIPATAHPSNWGRLPTHDSLDAFDDADRAAYRPFNALSGKFMNNRSANYFARAGEWSAKAAPDSMQAKAADAVFGRARKWGLMTKNEVAGVKAGKVAPDMFSGGVYSRITASAKIAGWGNQNVVAPAKYGRNMASFLTNTDKGLAAASKFKFGNNLELATRGQLADLSAMTSRGRISQAAGGYFRGITGGVSREMQDFALANGRNAFRAGAGRAAAHLGSAGIENVGGELVAKGAGAFAKKLGMQAGEKIGLGAVGKMAMTQGGKAIAAKAGLAVGARAVGMWIPGINVAMAAWTAYDMTKMGMELMKGGGEFALEGYKSFQGSLYKPAMGMGYRDTEVAATSRARGVMAIQNSRLNARSALGSEASSMANHFG
jgi:hypothetical protein